ncbi:MAG: retropepsin-like domain-containing protein [Planctomycetes bacterium]|nr:retropepsin-like domain-containing protein [Planctomycetota bacterium]
MRRSHALSLLALLASPVSCELPGDLRPTPTVDSQALILPKPTYELDLIADSRWVLTEVQLGDRTLLAAYDTGLSVRAMIDEALCEELELPLSRGLWSTDGGSGRGYKRGTVLPPLRWGSFSLEPIRALCADLSFLKSDDGRAVQLILGMPLFGRDTLQIDVPMGVLRVFQDTSLPPIGTAHVLAMRRWRDVPFCPLRIGERNLRLMLDSGFEGALSLPDSLRKELPLRGEARRTGKVRTALGEGGAIHTGRLGLDLDLAGYRFEAPAVQFLEGYRHAVLGRRSLEVLVWTLDPVNGRVHFGLPAPNSEREPAGILGGLPFPFGVSESKDEK